MRQKIAVVFILLMLCTGVSGVAQSIHGLAPGDSVTLPSYVRIVRDANDPSEFEMTDSVFYSIAGSTIFRVNRTELNVNDPFVIDLANNVLPLANTRGWQLVGVSIRGAASPEGPYWNNERLSIGRAAALNKYIEAHLDSINLHDHEFTATISEDYQGLVWSMLENADPDTHRVQALIDRYGGDPWCIKRDLKKMDGGRLWTRLYREYFPELRAARVVLFFQRIDPRFPSMPQRITQVMGVEVAEPVAQPVLQPMTYDWHYSILRRHIFSLSTNLLYDGFYMPNFGWAPSPNVGLEWFALDHVTLRGAFLFPYYQKWDKKKFFQIRDYHLELRYYFRPGDLHTGWYLGGYGNVSKYGIGFGPRKGWEGEGWGAALKLGYVCKLGGGRWRLDFHVAGGYYETRYDPYVYGNPITGEDDGKYYYDYTGLPSEFHKRNYRRTWIGPTEVGITLSYDILYKRRTKPGVSVIRKEVIR